MRLMFLMFFSTASYAFLSGCMGMGAFSTPQDYVNMTAAQIKAAAADKEVSIVCADTPTPWGIMRFRHLQSDKGIFANGGNASSTGEGCGVQVNHNPPQPRPSGPATGGTVPNAQP